MVEGNYQNNLSDSDAKTSINPLLDCEPEATAIDVMVKIENDRFDSCVSTYEAVYIPSTTYWDDLNKRIDNYKNEGSSNAQEPINDSTEILPANQGPVVSEPKKKKESHSKSVGKAASKTKKTTKRKTVSIEPKRKPRNPAKEAIITVDGVM